MINQSSQNRADQWRLPTGPPHKLTGPNSNHGKANTSGFIEWQVVQTKWTADNADGGDAADCDGLNPQKSF
jgi:hypothetical protein